MAIIDRFPGIKRVALEVAYDNGIIHRNQTEEEWLDSLDFVLGAEGVYEADLLILDQWCQTLSDEEANTLAAGEHSDMLVVQAKCPKPELCDLFDDIFEGGNLA